MPRPLQRRMSVRHVAVAAMALALVLAGCTKNTATPLPAFDERGTVEVLSAERVKSESAIGVIWKAYQAQGLDFQTYTQALDDYSQASLGFNTWLLGLQSVLRGGDSGAETHDSAKRLRQALVLGQRVQSTGIGAVNYLRASDALDRSLAQVQANAQQSGVAVQQASGAYPPGPPVANAEPTGGGGPPTGGGSALGTAVTLLTEVAPTAILTGVDVANKLADHAHEVDVTAGEGLANRLEQSLRWRTLQELGIQ